ncbi:MAG: hypothetical protein WD740_09005 [Anaerolineales bacterium]
MYQNTYYGDDTRLRSLPLEYGYVPQRFVGLPQVRLTEQARVWAGEALIALGTRLKPQPEKRLSPRPTTAWQGR